MPISLSISTTPSSLLSRQDRPRCQRNRRRSPLLFRLPKQIPLHQMWTSRHLCFFGPTSRNQIPMSYFVPRAVSRSGTPASFHENLGLQILRFTWPRGNWQKTQLPEKPALTTLPVGSSSDSREHAQRQQLRANSFMSWACTRSRTLRRPFLICGSRPVILSTAWELPKRFGLVAFFGVREVAVGIAP